MVDPAPQNRAPTRRSRRYWSKRAFDLVVLAVVAVPASVVGLAAAAFVRLTSSGPVLFRQQRVGLNSKPFTMLKFRSMVHSESGNPLEADESYVTAAGRFLRRFSLDELPQLINVLRGEMSIVGPRPTVQQHVDRYTDHQRRRLEVHPGLTGLAQVTGRRDLHWFDRIDLDVEYVDTQSLLLDLRILVKTPRALLDGSGGSFDGEDPWLT